MDVTPRRSARQEMQRLDDAELVERATGGDHTAFEVLVLRHEREFLRAAWAILSDEAAAYDALQTAFLKIYRKLDSFRGDASFKSWGYRIVVNCALSRIRKHKRRQEVALDEVGPAAEEPTESPAHAVGWAMAAEQAAQNAELRGRIVAAVADLEPKYRTVFVLHELEGLELDEVADIIGLSRGGAKTRLHRARLHLRAYLQRYIEA